MMPFAVAKCETTVMFGSPVTRSTRSRDGFSHQSISPLRNAASAENGSKVSHSTRSKCATFGPAVKPTLLPSARPVLREPGEHRAGAADMLVLQKPVGVAADNLGDRLERRFLRQTLRHDHRRVAARTGQGLW